MYIPGIIPVALPRTGAYMYISNETKSRKHDMRGALGDGNGNHT